LLCKALPIGRSKETAKHFQLEGVRRANSCQKLDEFDEFVTVPSVEVKVKVKIYAGSNQQAFTGIQERLSTSIVTSVSPTNKSPHLNHKAESAPAPS